MATAQEIAALVSKLRMQPPSFLVAPELGMTFDFISCTRMRSGRRCSWPPS
jgi:hypothetical protein